MTCLRESLSLRSTSTVRESAPTRQLGLGEAIRVGFRELGSTISHVRQYRTLVLFLVADDAGFITGSTLSINGGQHMY